MHFWRGRLYKVVGRSRASAGPDTLTRGAMGTVPPTLCRAPTVCMGLQHAAPFACLISNRHSSDVGHRRLIAFIELLLYMSKHRPRMEISIFTISFNPQNNPVR